MTDCEGESVKHCPAVTGKWKSEMVRRSVGVEEVRKALSSYEARGGLSRVAEQI